MVEGASKVMERAGMEGGAGRRRIWSWLENIRLLGGQWLKYLNIRRTMA